MKRTPFSELSQNTQKIHDVKPMSKLSFDQLSNASTFYPQRPSENKQTQTGENPIITRVKKIPPKKLNNLKESPLLIYYLIIIIFLAFLTIYQLMQCYNLEQHPQKQYYQVYVPQ